MEAGYDDRRLREMFAELEPRRRLQALRGAYRKEANRVRKTAAAKLKQSGIDASGGLEKGIRSVVFRQKAGFRVTVGTKAARGKGKEKGFYTSRRALKYNSGTTGKPVLLWAEAGTKARTTKGRGRKAHTTGRMPKYGFMEATLSAERGKVATHIQQELLESVERTAKKYGCK